MKGGHWALVAIYSPPSKCCLPPCHFFSPSFCLVCLKLRNTVEISKRSIFFSCLFVSGAAPRSLVGGVTLGCLPNPAAAASHWTSSLCSLRGVTLLIVLCCTFFFLFCCGCPTREAVCICVYFSHLSLIRQREIIRPQEKQNVAPYRT